MVPIVCVVGKSGVGKTYVMERLVAELKRRRYRVATIKHSASGFDIDHEGKGYLEVRAGGERYCCHKLITEDRYNQES